MPSRLSLPFRSAFPVPHVRIAKNRNRLLNATLLDNLGGHVPSRLALAPEEHHVYSLRSTFKDLAPAEPNLASAMALRWSAKQPAGGSAIEI